MQTVRVEIEGVTALLMHQFPMQPIEALEKKPIGEQAKLAAYLDEHEILYVPGIAIQRALIGGATYSKGKGRSSLQKNVAACVSVSPERVSLHTKEYQVDSRPVVVPATKGRVMRHRARIDKWKLTFDVEYDETLLTRDQLNRILIDTGQRVGLLDFCPERKGPFGRFIVTKFQ